MRNDSSANCEIVVVTHFFESHGGGIERVASSLVEHYLKEGHAVAWFASDTDMPPEPRENLSLHPIRSSNVIERLTHLPFPIWTPLAIPALWKAIGKAQAVHVHEHFYLGSVLAIVIGKTRGRRVVITQHIGEMAIRSRLLARVCAAGSRLLARAVMPLANHVAFVSATVMRFFGGSSAPDTDRTILFNGLNTDVFEPAHQSQIDQFRARLSIPADRKVALFAGRYVRKKGMPFLKQLVKATPDLTWLFAGAGPLDPSEWDLPNVITLGRLQAHELALAYSVADVLVLPSKGEGFPLVVQEALACGAAVLTTPEVSSACPEIAPLLRTAGAAGERMDVSEWIRALTGTLTTPDAAAARAERASRARVLWSWRKCAGEYLDLLLPTPSRSNR